MDKDCNCQNEKPCDCGSKNGSCNNGMEDLPVIFLTFDDSEEEVPCDVLGIFPVDGINYIAVIPKMLNEDEEEEVLIYRYAEDENDIQLSDIETDEEYDRVSDEFFEIFLEEDDEEDDDEDDELEEIDIEIEE
ncbi:MAG: hypothetical protein ATN31_10280 [Candidatus Epulonipiscioides saccharophilum]|nr:MAG: hypothetical protein ATN31_10280 [Epulopiscium sp. AS2M-Bin001]